MTVSQYRCNFCFTFLRFLHSSGVPGDFALLKRRFRFCIARFKLIKKFSMMAIYCLPSFSKLDLVSSNFLPIVVSQQLIFFFKLCTRILPYCLRIVGESFQMHSKLLAMWIYLNTSGKKWMEDYYCLVYKCRPPNKEMNAQKLMRYGQNGSTRPTKSRKPGPFRAAPIVFSMGHACRN